MLAEVRRLDRKKLNEPLPPPPKPLRKVTVLPNGETSYGFIPREKIRKSDADYERCVQETEQIIEFQYHWNAEDKEAKKLVKIFSAPQDRFINSSDPSRKSERKIQPGISTHGRRQLRNAVFLMNESRPYYGSLGFYTFTIPALCDEDLQSVHINFKTCVVRLLEKLKKRYEYKNPGIELPYAYCIEPQSKRAAKDGRGFQFWHLHVVMPAYKKGKKIFWVTATGLRKLWRETLKQYCGCQDVNFNATVDSQILKRNPEAYVSKYIAKNKINGNENVRVDANFRKWGVSARLHQDIFANTYRGGDADYLQIMQFEENILYHHKVYVTIQGLEVCVGGVLKLKNNLYYKFLSLTLDKLEFTSENM